MMLTEESKTDVYPTLDWEGTAGTQAVANEDAVWDNSTGGAVGVATNRVAKPANMGTSGTNGSYSGYVKKTSPGGAIGAAKLLKVMSGDQIATSVDYYWPSATVNNSSANGISTLTTSLLSILANTAGVSAAVKGAIPTVNSGLTADPNIISKITTPENNSSGSTQPKAYLHVLLFNEQFQFDNANSYVQQIGTTSNVVATLTQTVTVKKNGYAYIYFSNESNNDVYFDNFKLTDVRGQILEESHYYPFGLTMSAISSKAISFGQPDNHKKYNGIEFDEDLSIEEYEAYYRNLDPQIGRWWQIDPKCEASINPDAVEQDETIPEGLESVSPYASMSDDPAKHSDPLGDAPCCAVAAEIFKWTQRVAAAIEIGGGGPLDLPADAVAAVVEVVGVTASAVSAAIEYSNSLSQIHPLTPPAPPVTTPPTSTTATAKPNANQVNTNTNNQGSGEGRGKNNRKPDSKATGDHTVSNSRGSTTYKKNDRNPTGYDEVKRVDTKGKADNGVPTPHVHERNEETGVKIVRPANSNEIPKTDLSKNKPQNGQ